MRNAISFKNRLENKLQVLTTYTKTSTEVYFLSFILKSFFFQLQLFIPKLITSFKLITSLLRKKNNNGGLKYKTRRIFIVNVKFAVKSPFTFDFLLYSLFIFL